MQATSIPDPVSSEFAPICADLARLFLARKVDLGLGDQPDSFIVDNVNRIAGAIMAAGAIAMDRGDESWLQRHCWYSDAVTRLFADEVAVPLDG